MKRLLQAVVVIVTIAYPFMVYWGLQHYAASQLLPLLLLLLALRWIVGNRPGERHILLAVLLAVVLVGFLFGQQLGLKFYPALVNFGFLLMFAASLLSPPSFVERIARLRDPELPAAAISYTRRVTWAWTIFFAMNGSIAASTALWGTDEIWMLYNGFIAYLLIGLLAGGEWLLRQRVLR